MAVRRILVPVDLSGISEVAIDQAARLATGLSAELVVLHVAPHDTAARLDDLRARLERFAAGRPGLDRGLLAAVDVAVGDVPEEIARHCHARRCDLVVVASHSAVPREAAGQGSVAARVAEICPAPVLVLRPSADPLAIARVVVPTDFSADATAAIAWAGDLTRALGARLAVLHAAPEGFDAAALARRLREQVEAAEIGHRVTTELVVASGDPVEAIMGYVHVRPTDLIVVASHRRPGEMRASVAGQLVAVSRVAVAVLHPRLGAGWPGADAGSVAR